MEVIKTSPNVEFDVIYADGTRKRVCEGILFETDGDDMVLHNGTDRAEVLIAAVETALMCLPVIGPGLEILAGGMASTEDSCAVLKRLVKIASNLLGIDRAEKQACFRLGQKDMQASIVDMLENAAASTYGMTQTALLVGVDMIKGLEVDGHDKG